MASDGQRLAQEVADACAPPWVRKVLAGLPRPGGLDATEKAARWAAVGSDSHVLVPGCGRGASPVYLARTFRCRVLGITADHGDLTAGREEAKRQGVEALVTLDLGDSVAYTYPVSAFDEIGRAHV